MNLADSANDILKKWLLLAAQILVVLAELIEKGEPFR